MEKVGLIEGYTIYLTSVNESGKNAWYQTHENLGELARYKEDLERGRRLANQKMKNLSNLLNKPINEGNLSLEIKYALMSSSLCNLSYNIPSSLLTALVKANIKTAPYALTVIGQNPDEQRKADALWELKPYLEAYWQDAFKIAQGITDLYWKTIAISAVAPFVQEQDTNLYPILRTLQQEASLVSFEVYRLRILGTLGELLPEGEAKVIFDNLFQEAQLHCKANSANSVYPLLEIICFLKNEKRKTKIIKNILKKVWRVGIDSYELDFFEIIARILYYLPSSKKSKEVRKAYKRIFIRKENQRQAQALRAILSYLPESLVKDAQEKFKDKPHRHEAYTSLAKRLAELGYKDEALKIARSLNDSFDRCQALSLVATHLKETDYEVLDLALEETQKLSQNYLVYKVLLKLAPRLPNVLLEKALDLAQVIDDVSKQSQYIKASILYIAELGNIKIALSLLDKVKDYLINIRASARLLTYLDKENQKKMAKSLIRKVLRIEPDFWRCMELARIIPYLPEQYKIPCIQYLIQCMKHVDVPKGGEWAIACGDRFNKLSFQLANQGYLKESVTVIGLIGDILNIDRAIRKAVKFFKLGELTKLFYWVQGLQICKDSLLTVLSFRLADLDCLGEALNNILFMEDDHLRIKILEKIVDVIVKQNRKDRLERLLNILLEGDLKSKHLLLSTLSTYFDGENKNEILKKALEIFAIALSNCAEGDKKLQLYLPMIPFLADPNRKNIIEECQNIIRDFGDPIQKSRFNKQLITILIEIDYLEESIGIVKRIEDEYWRMEALRSFFPYIATLAELYEKDIIKECKSVIKNLKFRPEEVHFLEDLCESLIKSKSPRRVFRILKGISNEYWRAKVLKTVLPSIPITLKKELLILINSFSEISTQHSLFLELASCKLEVLAPEKLIEITRTIINNEFSKSERLNILSKLAENLILLPMKLLYSVWQEILQKLSSKKREFFLEDLAVFLPIMDKLGSIKLIEEVATSVEQVGGWWE